MLCEQIDNQFKVNEVELQLHLYLSSRPCQFCRDTHTHTALMVWQAHVRAAGLPNWPKIITCTDCVITLASGAIPISMTPSPSPSPSPPSSFTISLDVVKNMIRRFRTVAVLTALPLGALYGLGDYKRNAALQYQNRTRVNPFEKVASNSTIPIPIPISISISIPIPIPRVYCVLGKPAPAPHPAVGVVSQS